MTVAIFGKQFKPDFTQYLMELFSILHKSNSTINVYEPFYKHIKDALYCKPQIHNTFTSSEEVIRDADYVISIGGDGTFLEAVTLVRDSGIPLVGINSGRLGFLADISKKNISQAIDSILNKQFIIEQRVLIELHTNNQLFTDWNYALNELTIHKKDSSSMITVHAYINGEYLNTYWADGLIISTPTGSTAYSLSAGGPIVIPNSENFIIAPIAPHNLAVRPIIVPDSSEIQLRVEGRSVEYLASLDYRTEFFDDSVILRIKRAKFKINTLKLPEHSYYKTLRNKLMWGADKRNS